jgi:hypothetical protein
MHGRNHTKDCNKAQNINIIWKKQQINKKISTPFKYVSKVGALCQISSKTFA